MAKMGLWVLEDLKLDHVPGTVLLDQNAGRSEDITGGRKHGTGKDTNIVLAPQPSEDPNDPLNWPGWRKLFVFCILLMSSVMCAGIQVSLLFSPNADIEKGAVLAPGTVQIATELGTTIPRIALLAGYYLLAVGPTGYPFTSYALSKLSPFISAFATKYGKRPVFVFSSTMLTIGVRVGRDIMGLVA